eukprot:766670-Hanusia_phi.AAC.1
MQNQAVPRTLLKCISRIYRVEGTLEQGGGVIAYQVIGHILAVLIFLPEALVRRPTEFFSLLTPPLRISMRLSDRIDYQWIVKCGEDLRQHEHMQQVEGFMNRRGASDANCSKKILNPLTCSVVTLSKSAGIIQFVEGTKSEKLCGLKVQEACLKFLFCTLNGQTNIIEDANQHKRVRSGCRVNLMDPRGVQHAGARSEQEINDMHMKGNE